MVVSRTLDPRVVSSNPSQSVSCARVPGQNTTTNYRCLLGYDTENCRSLLLAVYARGSKRPQSGYISVTSSKL